MHACVRVCACVCMCQCACVCLCVKREICDSNGQDHNLGLFIRRVEAARQYEYSKMNKHRHTRGIHVPLHSNCEYMYPFTLILPKTLDIICSCIRVHVCMLLYLRVGHCKRVCRFLSRSFWYMSWCLHFECVMIMILTCSGTMRLL